uniref:Bestrophin homolog n=1 Tax=Romanomermis culicivorax TaxID=13658 RepID=A0A915ITR7_ROMCU
MTGTKVRQAPICMTGTKGNKKKFRQQTANFADELSSGDTRNPPRKASSEADLISVVSNKFIKKCRHEMALKIVLMIMVTAQWQKSISSKSRGDCLNVSILANEAGDSKENRLKRHTAARYLALCQLLVYRDISMEVRRRFPRLIEVANSGMMTFEEYTIFQRTVCKNVRWQLPLQWIIYNILLPLCKPSIPRSLSQPTTVALSQESLDQIIKELCAYRKSLYNLYLINWINFPFIYVQIAVCV